LDPLLFTSLAKLLFCAQATQNAGLARQGRDQQGQRNNPKRQRSSPQLNSCGVREEKPLKYGFVTNDQRVTMTEKKQAMIAMTTGGYLAKFRKSLRRP
jgi:hypothetical protein